MIPLKEEFGVEALRQKCEMSKSRIYGFILYSDRDPYVKKALRDDDFWDALDRRSGPNWPIFSARPKKEGSYYTPEASPGTIQYLTRIWREPDDNQEFLELFGINSSRILPCFVAFMWDDNDELNRFIVKIESGSQDEVYKSLQGIIDTITDTESHILEEYKGSVNVFREVVNNLKDRKFQVVRKEIFNPVSIMRFILSLK